MPSNAEPLRHLFPTEQPTRNAFQQLMHDNPLPPELKRSVLEALMGPSKHTDHVVHDLGLDTSTGRPLSMHEQVTLDAVQGRGGDVGNRELLRALRQTRGADLMAWADLAAVATHMRVGGY
jgi:hypothetical protein